MTSPGEETLRLDADAVVLDLDGLLIDSESAAFNAARAILAEEGSRSAATSSPRTSADRRASCTPGSSSGSGCSPPSTTCCSAATRGSPRSTRPIAPMPGAIGFVRTVAARGIAVGVASSSQDSCVDRAVGALGLHDAVSVVVGWGHPGVGAPKPAPDLFLVALSRLGVSPSVALGVEDSPTGATASIAAGLTTVVVPNE